MRAFVMGVSFVALGACASSGSTSAAAPARPDVQTVRGGSAIAGSLTVTSNTSAAVTSLAVPLDRVWKVLPAAFDSLGIPLGTLDPNRHLIGYEGFKVRQRLGKTALSRYLDCGTTQVGANADSYEVVLTVLTQLQPGASGTTSLATTVEANARPIAFSQAPSRCTSTTVLESRLLDAVKAQLK